MDNSCSMAPVWFTDVAGSAVAILLSFFCVLYARLLVRTQPSNVIWTYLLWLSVALAGFAVSRGVGHIAKRTLMLMDMPDVWVSLRPFSGGINTIAFVVVAAITLFFQRVHKINTMILEDKRALEEAGHEVMRLNRDLESLVRKRTEELSRSEQKYRRIFEGSMDMIFIVDEAGRFLDINQAGLSTLGYDSRDDVIGGLDLGRIFVSREDHARIMEELHDRGFVKDHECRFLTKGGSELLMLLSATVRRGESGKVVSYEGIAKDLTARVRMEKQLQQANRLASLGQISTGIAHEINNPLGVMLGYTQLLLREHKAGTQIHDDLKTIEKHARNCRTIIEDLLKFARGTITNKAFIDVNQCLREVASLLAHQLELDNITLEIHPDVNLPPVLADAEKLKQVFMNLIMNARHAISGQGRISLETFFEPAKERVLISVSDTGAGIHPELIDKIFNPFFTTKPPGEGTGLGLSVSYGIIQDHNGRIEVRSEINKGSTFTIVLPLKEEPVVADAISKKWIAETGR